MSAYQPGDRIFYDKIVGRGKIQRCEGKFIRSQIVGRKRLTMFVIELDEGPKRVRQVSPVGVWKA